MSVERKLFHAAVGPRAIDREKRTIRFVVSSRATDRDGDLVEPNGWDLSSYLNNPVVLWAHDAERPPIGRALSMDVDRKALRGVAKFTTEEENPFGAMVFRLYCGGFLNAVSAGFLPLEQEPIEDGRGIVGMHFRRQALHEFSAVPVPSNPEALVAAKAARIDLRPLKSWCEASLDAETASVPREMIGAAYKALSGKSSRHAVRSNAVFRHNIGRLEAMRKKQGVDVLTPNNNPLDSEIKEGTEALDAITLVAGGDTPHTHDLIPGAAQTEPAEDGHVHAVTYYDDGSFAIEPAEGHSHEVPENVAIELDGETEEQKEGAVEIEEDDGPESTLEMDADLLEEDDADLDELDSYEAEEDDFEDAETDEDGLADLELDALDDAEEDEFEEIETDEFEDAERPKGRRKTHFPNRGENKSVALGNSAYERFPLREAQALRRHFPELWSMGGRFDTDALIRGSQKSIRAREQWAADHIGARTVAELMGQVKRLVVDEQGLSAMRRRIAKAKQLALEARAMSSSYRRAKRAGARVVEVTPAQISKMIEDAVRRERARR